MDYILASLFALMVAALAAYYQRLNARVQALEHAHANLVQALNLHIHAIALHAQPHPTLHVDVQRLLRKLCAIQTMGLPSIDQQMDVYDALWAFLQTNMPDELIEPHTRIQSLKAAYNRTALHYNDCQRSSLQSRLSSLFGHSMAPPC